MKLTRVPIESPAPVGWLGVLRLGIVLAAFAIVVTFDDVPRRDTLVVLIAAVALPWALALLWLARRAPAVSLHPLVGIGDLLILALLQMVAPAAYAGIGFLAVFLVAAQANYQGQQRGTVFAVLTLLVFIPIAIAGDEPANGSQLAFFEFLFAVSVLSAGLFLGRLRTAESTARLRARELSRRTIEAEAHVRRRVAESIHDGPVQELVSMDMMLDAARRALEREKPERAVELIEEARHIAERNIGALRDEIVGLGPYAFDELTVDAALEQCVPTWSRRYEIEIGLTLERLNLVNEACGSLFGIAQEAVVNAGRHAQAQRVAITLRTVDSEVELRVSDDGRGFDGEQPLGPDETGHIGLATMRDRAELLGGRLEIRTGSKGSTVIARVPKHMAVHDEVEPFGRGDDANGSAGSG